MRLFLLPDSFTGSDTLKLTGRDYNYIINVLRLKEGQNLTGRDCDGNIWNLKLITIDKGFCILETQSCETARETTDALPEDRPTRNIILYQCLPKARKLDDIVKKATEIGALAIVPVISKNCIAKIDGKEENRLSRYQAIIKEAVQQSGSLIPTTIENPIKLESIPDDFSIRCSKLGQEGLGLFLHQCKLKEKQSNLYESLHGFGGTIGIVVGPEGGFSDDECNYLLDKCFKAVLLRSNILRCETASIYALSAVQTIVETGC